MVLSVSDVVNVSVTFSPVAAAVRNFGALMIIGTSDVIPLAQRFRSYSNLTGVANDFGTTAAEYLAAEDWFSQNPQPVQLYIGRWANVATKGFLDGGVIGVSSQPALITTMNAITNGSFQITIAGTLRTITALNFSTDTTMTAIAARINTALVSGSYGTCTWNPYYNYFEIKTASPGPVAGTITFASAGGGGTDITAPLNLTQAEGASIYQGSAAETALAAVTAIADISNAWYGCMFAPAAVGDLVNNDYLAVAGFIEGASPARIFGAVSQEGNALTPGDVTNLPYLMKAANYKRSLTQYSSSDLYAVASLFARGFTTDFTANNTALTLKFKQEPGVVAETLNETQASVLNTNNCNVFVNYDNSTAIIQQGVMANGFFFDEVQGTDWLANAIQTAVYNLLYTSPTKIPQTDPGIHMIVNVIEGVLAQSVNNGLVAPGQWNGPPIGEISQGQYLTKGFYVYVQPIALQDQSTREQRIAPPIQVLVKMAGAVHFANVLISVNR